MEYLPVFIILMCALFNYNGGASVTRIKRSGFDWAIDDYGCRIPGSGSGDCISINKCKAFQSFIPDRDDYICGYDGNQVKVCCPPELPSSIGPKSALDHSQHRNIGLLPTRDVCGKSEPIVRIVNGNLTDLSEYPWAAALKFNKSDYPYSCGATLISKRYVLTAAHCIRNPFTLLSVRLGEYNFSSAVDCVGFGKQKICANEPQDFQVSADDAIVHPEHVPKKYINDIALIRLPRDAVLDRSGYDWGVDDYGCRTPGLGSGQCLNINKCKAFQNFIPDRDGYICGTDGNQVKVCCPPALPSRLRPESTLDHSKHPNIGLLPTSQVCGKSDPVTRIVYGNLTDLFEFPWAAVLKFDTRYNPYSCGASIISKRYVLTAAHCASSQTKLVSVRLGEYNFTSPIDCVEGFDGQRICAKEHQDFQISPADVIVHPQYDAKKFLNDIALIRLPRDAVLNEESVVPICLPIKDFEKKKTYENYTIVGWGTQETGFSSKVLLKALVPTVDNSICASRYQRQTQVTDNQLCAGGKNSQDACTGDSGSPLSNDYIYEDGSIRAIQYGLVSFGPGRDCGRESYPVVYTKIASYVQWILDNIKP